MERHHSATRLFLLLLLLPALCSAYTNPADVAALKSVMKRIKNTPPSWGKSNDPCSAPWEGILCINSSVTAVKLFGLGLEGILAAEIGDLSELRALELSSNEKLGGVLPATMGKLTQLVSLRLVGCSFVGEIPEELGNLSQLKYLAINSNYFTGRIPPSLGKLSNILWLDLGDNRLSGPLPVSSRDGVGLNMLLTAGHFHLNGNFLSGVIPEDLFSADMQLEHLLLDRNNLSGPIPASIGNLSKLEVLRLNDNSLTGPVPASINNLTSLSMMNLANNNLGGKMPDLTGMSSLQFVDLSNNSFDPSEVPGWFSNLQRITALKADSGKLSGNIPQVLFSLPNLQQVTLSNNHFNGTFDMGGNISSSLGLVDLQNNSFSSVVLSTSYRKILKLSGNLICSNPNLLSTSYCGNETGVTRQAASSLPSCANPFQEWIIFRAVSFADFSSFTETLVKNISVRFTNCSSSTISLTNAGVDGDGYLHVEIELCPLNKKFFNRSEVARCFDLNQENYRAPKIFGPYHIMASVYKFRGTAAKRWIVGLVVACILLVVGLLAVIIFALWQKKRLERALSITNPFASWGATGEETGEAPKLRGAKFFPLDELQKITDEFKEKSVVGEGAYAKVYRGVLPPDDQIVAIKKFKKEASQGGLEFKAEIELLSRVHHKNLVGLVGFCFEKGEQILVYEFVHNGTLRSCLSGKKSGVKLDWKRRLLVALDSARGLAYLHDHADPPIIHRDIKSTNILLDEHLTAKVADFGLSLFVSDSEMDYFTDHVEGTPGYVDPEYCTTHQLTGKSDVYSFGVVMMELVTGKLPLIDGKHVIDEVKRGFNREDRQYCGLEHLIDPIIIRGGTLHGFERFVELALQCVEFIQSNRPAMNDVVKEIEMIVKNSGNSTWSPQANSSPELDLDSASLWKDFSTTTRASSEFPSTSGFGTGSSRFAK